MTSGDVLARIDSTLEAWERGPDAAKWQPDGGPDKLGPATPDLLRACEQVGAALAPGMARFAAGLQQMAASLSRAVLPFGKFLNDLGHGAHKARYPRKHIRCRRCNPAGNPRALAINGAAYRQRQRNRRKRRR